ncbi:probable oxidoreductase (aldo-keto reductase family protein) (plasmid) [Halobacterium hubeiense]|uniref:Probable oxidoreductase (Aldo-keto reductase family protein) n=1 Tax=Halobacterium hubeiense TaxID=1407499 RepID=A0A0U5D2F3_9EURY|nr:aldo/keto reductase [Halobacterium hubeiense]CQH64746.1 probable oxidoreductase (aldo-keto reductase family protein) [Halobacterium hubeiense]
MEYTTLGSTGMEVSKICLGCMSFGSNAQEDWILGEEGGREIIERAIDLGINFFDTANVYSSGTSEQILGNVLSDYDRDEQVVATKVRFPGATDHRNAAGLSRKTIEQELQHSLDRLGMDTVDLYQIHRWDYDTPIEETLRALDDAVRRNQVRYIGASSMWTHQFQEALHTSDRLALERFQAMQNHYALAYREEEREMLPLCEKEGIGVIPWSPLAHGYFTRPHEEMDATTRGETHDPLYDHPYREGGGIEINERVEELAEEKGVTMAQIALAWHFHKDWVDAPIVGTTSVEHLEQAVEALDIDLSDSDIEYLEDPYEPVEVTTHE